MRKLFLTVIAVLFSVATMNTAQAGAYEDFFLAIQFDDERRLRNLLLRGVDPNSVSEKGFSAVAYAVVEDSPKALQTLLMAPGLDVNAPDARGDSALMTAAARNKPLMVDLLLKHGAVQRGHGQWTAMHYAAASGSVESLALLLKAGGLIDALAPNDSTPLMMAARQGKENAARFLLAEGANPGLVNQAGFNAAGYAMKAQRKDLAFEIMRREKALRNAKP